MITKLRLKTPGREADDEETKLYTRKDMQGGSAAGSAGNGSSDTISALILKGLGGKANLRDLDCCATRLRITVRDSGKVSDRLLKESGASGVIHKGDGVQVIYGPQVSVVKSRLEDFLETPESERLEEVLAEYELPDDPSGKSGEGSGRAERTSGGNGGAGQPSGARKPISLYAPLAGTVVPLSEVPDEAFAGGALGDGVAFEPSVGTLYAPCDGTVETLFDTLHAVTLRSEDGAEILLHIGLDTVQLGGNHFTAKVSSGQTVKKGDALISFDPEAIRKAGYRTVTPMVICNQDELGAVRVTAKGTVRTGDEVLRIG